MYDMHVKSSDDWNLARKGALSLVCTFLLKSLFLLSLLERSDTITNFNVIYRQR